MLIKNEITPVDAFGLGHCCVDYLAVLDPYPDKGKKGEVIDSLIIGGGPVPTALQVVTRYGGTTRFCGKVGDDSDGGIVIEGLTKGSVDTSQLVVDPGVTTARAYIWIDPHEGSRTVALNISRFTWLEPNEVNIDLARRCKVFLCDGRAAEVSIRCLKAAKESGVVTVFDAGAIRPRFFEMLSFCDFVIVSQDLIDSFKEKISPEHLARELVDKGAGTAVVTIGSEGVLWNNGVSSGRVASFQIEVYDSTGAGDVLHGGFIHGLLQGWNFEDCLRFGNAAAALSCRKLSGANGIPELVEVERLMGKSQR